MSANNKSSHINFEVFLDENNLPENINWGASGMSAQPDNSCKAILLSIWDGEKSETLKIDLWTKDMRVDEMNMFFSQTLISMSDTYQRATGNKTLADKIKEFGYAFGTDSEVIKKNEG